MLLLNIYKVICVSDNTLKGNWSRRLVNTQSYRSLNRSRRGLKKLLTCWSSSARSVDALAVSWEALDVDPSCEIVRGLMVNVCFKRMSSLTGECCLGIHFMVCFDGGVLTVIEETVLLGLHSCRSGEFYDFFGFGFSFCDWFCWTALGTHMSCCPL